ncbi:MAG TPA: hypothetical protein VKV32_16900 [Stellaceae bacterium]|nr:hypothetical protein [Stellaceae bacterium]
MRTLNEPAVRMSSYRFYYLNADGHIVDADWMPCLGDAAAAARARSLLAETHDYCVIEIWHGTRRVETIATATLESR